MALYTDAITSLPPGAEAFSTCSGRTIFLVCTLHPRGHFPIHMHATPEDWTVLLSRVREWFKLTIDGCAEQALVDAVEGIKLT